MFTVATDISWHSAIIFITETAKDENEEAEQIANVSEKGWEEINAVKCI